MGFYDSFLACQGDNVRQCDLFAGSVVVRGGETFKTRTDAVKINFSCAGATFLLEC
jgi:hypothetical protein